MPEAVLTDCLCYSYASQAYNRFMDQYFVSMSCEGRVFDICALAHAEMSKPAAYRLWRHVNLAHALTYVGLSETYTVDNFLRPLNEKYGLCSRAEWRRLEELKPEAGGGATREAITWAVNDIMMQTKHIEQPLRALEKLSMVALLKRAKNAKVDKRFWDEESPMFKMTLPPSDPRRLPPTANETKKVIAKIIEYPDQAKSIAEWDTAAVKEWILDLDGVNLRNLDVSAALDDHNICGPDLLHLDAEKLRTLGITSISQQARILEAVGLIAGENEVISDMRASELVSQVCVLRGKLATLYDYKGQPIPFFYVHLLFFISALYLPMFAYTLAMDKSIGVPMRCEAVPAEETCWFNIW